MYLKHRPMFAVKTMGKMVGNHNNARRSPSPYGETGTLSSRAERIANTAVAVINLVPGSN